MRVGVAVPYYKTGVGRLEGSIVSFAQTPMPTREAVAKWWPSGWWSPFYSMSLISAYLLIQVQICISLIARITTSRPKTCRQGQKERFIQTELYLCLGNKSGCYWVLPGDVVELSLSYIVSAEHFL